jgi:hypothetical protein
MKKKENWINDALKKEVDFSKTSISEEWIMNLKMIPKITLQLSWKEISWMAACIALLISLNFSVAKKTTTSLTETEQVYNSYFSQINYFNE